MKPIWTPFGLKPSDAAANDAGPHYADVQARGLAATIDLLLLFTLFYRPFDAMMRWLYASVNQELVAAARQSQHLPEILALLWQSQLPQWWMVNTALQTALLGLVVVAVQCRYRTTPGKWLLGLRIVDAASLEPPPRWKYALRFVGYVLAALPLMLGFMAISFNPRRRGLQDVIAGTVVIYTRPRYWLWTLAKQAVRRMAA